MSVFSFNNPIYWVFILLLSLFILFVKIYYARIVGWFGEYWTRKELKKLPKDEYKVINNIMINIDDKTHQIDHIVISKYGIFVIETKQYNGYIIGSKYDKKWIRKIGKKDILYTNPIRQNYGHILSICKLLNVDKSKVFNIVCIPSSAKINIKNDGEIARIYNLNSKILSKKDVMFNNIDNIVNILLKSNITNKRIRKKHIENIKNNIKKVESNTCPICGGLLKERNGGNGIFIGCSNYPRCKYTKSKE